MRQCGNGYHLNSVGNIADLVGVINWCKEKCGANLFGGHDLFIDSTDRTNNTALCNCSGTGNVATIQQIFNLLPQLGLMLVTWVAFAQPITWKWLLLIPITLLMVMFSTGLALVSARLTVHIQDLAKLIPFVVRITFYVSGIFFSMETVLKDYPLAFQISQYNPVYVFVSLARGAGVAGYETTPFMWIAASVWAVATLLIGVVFFWKAEERYGRED